MLLIKLDRGSREPVYRQIAQQIAKLVQTDALRAGDELPPTRSLAATLSVSRFTVSQAYDELWAQGYIESRQGSTTRVRPRPKLALPATTTAVRSGAPLHLSRAARVLEKREERALLPERGKAGFIDFSPLTLDPRCFPVDDLRGAFARVLRREHTNLLNYADPAGYGPLRDFVAARMKRHGIELGPSEVLITHGSEQALSLVLRLLANHGETVALEQPTYSTAMFLLEAQGLRALGVSVRESGMDLDALDAALRRRPERRPALVYTIPTYQNPTGITTSQSHRERLLELCERHQVPLVEDGFQEEISYFGRAVLPIKSMDRSGCVFYLGSFSKVFVPGLRMGWVAARPDAIRHLARLKHVEDLSCSPFVQAALHRFCASGAYELHLRRMNRTFAGRMRRAVAALRAQLPKSRVHFDEPSGGYVLWLRLSGIAATERDVLDALHHERVAATPGSLFYATPPPELALRLSVSSLDGDEIEEGARRLGRALRRV